MKRKIGKSAKIIGKRFILSDIIMINGRIQKHAKAQKPNFSVQTHKSPTFPNAICIPKVGLFVCKPGFFLHRFQKPNFFERNLLPKSWAFSFAVENHSSTAVKNNFIIERFTKIADSFIYT